MKTINLTQNQVALVSDEDYEYLSQFKWCAAWDEDTRSFRVMRTDCSGLRRTTAYMHRVILSRMFGRGLTRQEHVDHINHDTLDNRRENLRLASPSENQHNQRKHSNNTSGVTGVHWDKRAGKWKAYICVKRKLIHLGYYDGFDEAVSMRCRAEEYYFGDFKYAGD